MANIEVDNEFLNHLENAVANGADTLQKQADAMGLKLRTYNDLHYGKRKNGKEESAKIRNAIKKGIVRCYPELQKLSETELVKRLKGYYVEEVDEEISEYNGIETRKVKKKKRWVSVSTAELIFTLINVSGGKWQNQSRVVHYDSKDVVYDVEEVQE